MKNIKNLFIIIYLISTASVSIFAEDGSRTKEFYSPYFISGTSSVTQLLSPQSEAINPAAGALTQRVTLELSYLGILGKESSASGYKG
ncbi:MAG: hypothetical protein U9N32_09755, partial [Spirochaetota bacterium]|nr:hypothetical protein [Spirochaetota bacterium]